MRNIPVMINNNSVPHSRCSITVKGHVTQRGKSSALSEWREELQLCNYGKCCVQTSTRTDLVADVQLWSCAKHGNREVTQLCRKTGSLGTITGTWKLKPLTKTSRKLLGVGDGFGNQPYLMLHLFTFENLLVQFRYTKNNACSFSQCIYNNEPSTFSNV